MVKCSFILSIAVCAVVGSSALVEAVDTGSALNDTSVSVTVDASASTDTEVTPEVTTDSSASAPTDVAGVTTDGSATSTTTDVTDASSSAAVDVVDAPTDSSASVAVDVADVTTGTSSSTSSTTDASVGSDNTDPVAGNSTPTTSTVTTPKPTVKATTKPAVTVKTGPTPIDGQVTLVSGYAECGGAGFDYTVYMPEEPSTSDFTRLTCEAGYRCQDVEDSDVFQCKVWPSRDPVAFYGQCGGGSYDGQTFCAPGAVCKYISASFSQCLPTY